MVHRLKGNFFFSSWQSCGNIYKGLAQTGAWGCFDEFNRISVEVLSVVAVQVKMVLDGIKNRKKKFLFFGEELDLVNTVGMFITMNPGYAGRTELPENLKTLFRFATHLSLNFYGQLLSWYIYIFFFTIITTSNLSIVEFQSFRGEKIYKNWQYF